MRFLFIFFLTWVAAYFSLMIFPWWAPVLIAFMLVLIFQVKKTSIAFLAPALGSLCCCVMLILTRDIPNQHLLSRKIAILFQLPSSVFLPIISGLISFITAGLGGWTATCILVVCKPRSAARSETVSNLNID